NGQLKAINDPNFTAGTDPGNDAPTTNGFTKDVFGMMLEYYDNDYVRGTMFKTTSNLGTTYPNQYSGNIRSAVWSNQGTALTMAQYAYTYDNKNQLTEAVYGVNNGTQTFTADAANKYKVYATVAAPGNPVVNIGYDNNGNIQLLARNDGTGTAIDNMQLYYYG